MKYLLVLLIATFLIAGPAFATEKPTADETRKVITYYFTGQGNGAVLMDKVMCGEIGQEDPDKNECIYVIDPGRIGQNQELYIWMSFLVPSEATADILVSFNHKGKVRRTGSVKLKGATRFRTWKKIPTHKTGQWTATITQEMEDKDLELGSIQYTVVDTAPVASQQ